MEVKLIAHTPEPEKVLAHAAAQCYKKGPSVHRVLVIISNGHDSVLEHVNYTFQVDDISRACSHQLVRHRIASYTQQSQRYVGEEGFQFVVPPSIHGDYEAMDAYSKYMEIADKLYAVLREKGIKQEDARYILPNACCTSLTMTMNLRSLMNFWKLRMDPHAQWEIQELAKRTWNLVYDTLPAPIMDVIQDVLCI